MQLGDGTQVPEVARQVMVTVKTRSRWREEYGGLKTGQAKKLKELERKNARLKKLVADRALDKAMLQVVASGNF